MQKKTANLLNSYIGAAFLAIILVDTLLDIHPAGNIVGAVLLLVVCYEIGRSKNKGQ